MGTNLGKAGTRPVSAGTDEQLREDLLAMTQDAQQSGEEARGLRTQLANALTLAARMSPAASQTPEDRGDKYPDSPDSSGLDCTQLRGLTAHLRMVT